MIQLLLALLFTFSVLAQDGADIVLVDNHHHVRTIKPKTKLSSITYLDPFAEIVEKLELESEAIKQRYIPKTRPLVMTYSELKHVYLSLYAGLGAYMINAPMDRKGMTTETQRNLRTAVKMGGELPFRLKKFEVGDIFGGLFQEVVLNSSMSLTSDVRADNGQTREMMRQRGVNIDIWESSGMSFNCAVQYINRTFFISGIDVGAELKLGGNHKKDIDLGGESFSDKMKGVGGFFETVVGEDHRSETKDFTEIIGPYFLLPRYVLISINTLSSDVIDGPVVTDEKTGSMTRKPGLLKLGFLKKNSDGQIVSEQDLGALKMAIKESSPYLTWQEAHLQAEKLIQYASQYTFYDNGIQTKYRSLDDFSKFKVFLPLNRVERIGNLVGKVCKDYGIAHMELRGLINNPDQYSFGINNVLGKLKKAYSKFVSNSDRYVELGEGDYQAEQSSQIFLCKQDSECFDQFGEKRKWAVMEAAKREKWSYKCESNELIRGLKVCTRRAQLNGSCSFRNQWTGWISRHPVCDKNLDCEKRPINGMYTTVPAPGVGVPAAFLPICVPATE